MRERQQPTPGKYLISRATPAEATRMELCFRLHCHDLAAWPLTLANLLRAGWAHLKLTCARLAHV